VLGQAKLSHFSSCSETPPIPIPTVSNRCACERDSAAAGRESPSPPPPTMENVSWGDGMMSRGGGSALDGSPAVVAVAVAVVGTPYPYPTGLCRIVSGAIHFILLYTIV
jgi:hypothetical protein